jgi:hypothetical protein
MIHKCFTPENENPPAPIFQRGVLKVPLWKRRIEGDLVFHGKAAEILDEAALRSE